ncbi:MAG: hypothetical protein GDA45_01875 [Chromatiales bacterium]|nr:hypothetical protein [Chromatiales bacterium]
MMKIKAVSILLIIALTAACHPLKNTYKPERTTRSGICYTQYIEGKPITENCEQAVRYGQ